MQLFEKNIQNTFGEAGRKWLKNLSQVLTKLEQRWHLRAITPVSNMTYHFVATAVTQDDYPVVVKIGCDKHLIEKEAAVLKYFNGCGAIALLDYDPGCHALLIQQAVPGITLKSLSAKQMESTLDCYADIVATIHHRSFPKDDRFCSISEWLQAIDRAASGFIPADLLSKAGRMKNSLLASMKQCRLLHGDLHLSNILQHGGNWLCIDPQGVMGELEFEVAAFDFIDRDSLEEEGVPLLFRQRIESLADKAKLSPQRIKEWTFVRLILSAAWSIEDRGDPCTAIRLARLLEGVLEA